MSNELSEERIKSWVSAMLAGFGWEVNRQADNLNGTLPKPLENDNHPTSSNSVWRYGRGQGIYFLSHDGTVEIKTCLDNTDFDDVQGEYFFSEIRMRHNRGAEVLFVDQENTERVLTSSELASYFIDRVINKDEP